MEIRPLLVAAFDRAVAVVAARCAGREGEDGYWDVEEFGGRAG